MWCHWETFFQKFCKMWSKSMYQTSSNRLKTIQFWRICIDLMVFGTWILITFCKFFERTFPKGIRYNNIRFKYSIYFDKRISFVCVIRLETNDLVFESNLVKIHVLIIIKLIEKHTILKNLDYSKFKVQGQ